MQTSAKRSCFWLVLLVLIATTPILAQTYTATLTGTLTDQNGQPVPNVKVTATNQATNISSSTQTGDSGNYTIPFLPVGNYVVSAELKGFKKTISNTLTLEVNQTARVDLQMQVGEVSEQVVINDALPSCNQRQRMLAK